MSLRWRVLESGFSLYFQSLREAYACVASAVVFCFCLFLFFLVAIRGVCPRGDCCIFCNLFFSSPSRSARCFLARLAL